MHARSSPLAALGACVALLAIATLGRGTGAEPTREVRSPAPRSRVSGRLELNRASAAELETLPRVGPALAARIVAYRDAHGPFRSVEALDDVPGVGPATLATLRTRVTVSPHAGDPSALPDRNTPR